MLDQTEGRIVHGSRAPSAGRLRAQVLRVVVGEGAAEGPADTDLVPHGGCSGGGSCRGDGERAAEGGRTAGHRRAGREGSGVAAARRFAARRLSLRLSPGWVSGHWAGLLGGAALQVREARQPAAHPGARDIDGRTGRVEESPDRVRVRRVRWGIGQTLVHLRGQGPGTSRGYSRTEREASAVPPA